MKIYDSLFDASDMLFEQVVRRLTDTFVEEGPVLAVLDGRGGCWSTSPQQFERLYARQDLLAECCSRVGDGWEPVMTTIGGWAILAGQLRTDQRHHGYVIIGVPVDDRQHAAVNQPLLEMLLNQINTIAELIEKNNMLHHQQLKAMSRAGKEPSCVN
ncbi:MAG: hypothetical protein IH624_11700 [Phycisphaerae bacterium]|nr:hypothetical protein [Phycisphaerae bacterium]